MSTSDVDHLIDSLFLTASESLLKKSVVPNGVGTLRSREEMERYIEFMSGLAAGLQTRFQAEVAEISKRRNATLGIHQIPNDVLSDILFLVIDPESDDPKKYCRQRNDLESVCTTWKSTICSSAELWRIISSALPSRINNRSLKFSRQHLLTCVASTKTPRARNEQFWRNIKPHADRFATIEALMLNALLPILGNGLPQVRKLKLVGDGDRAMSEQCLVSPLTNPWPLLESLDLRGVSIPWTSSLVNNITSLVLLHIIDLSFTLLVEMLQSSPQLHDLEISLVSMKESTVLPCAEIPLPALRSLSFFSLAIDVLECLFGALKVTILDKFALTHNPSPTEPEPELSALPTWTIDSAVSILRQRPILILHPDVEVANGGYGLRFHGSSSATLSWLRSILEHYPESAPQIKLQCFNFDLELLDQFLTSQLDRCELRFQYRGPTLAYNIQHLCRRLPTGKFPFPYLSELTIYLDDEETAGAYADLLEERYRAPMEMKPLKELQYVSLTAMAIFKARLSSLLEDCNVEWKPAGIWPAHTDDTTTEEAEAYSDDHSTTSEGTQDEALGD